MRSLSLLLLVSLGLAMLPPGLRADAAQRSDANPQRPANGSDDDAGLMEFLGGIGSESDDWIRYLGQTDPTKVAAAPPRRPVTDANRPVDPPAGSEKK